MEYLMCGIEGEIYALPTGIIEQIVQKQFPTRVKDNRAYIEGIISWRDSVLKIVSLRKLLGFETYKEQQLKIIQKVKGQHVAWVEDFSKSMKEDAPFTKALDPCRCELGRWIEETLHCLKCNDHGFNNLIKEILVEPHNALHTEGKRYLANKADCEDIEACIDEISGYKDRVLLAINELEKKIDTLANAYERVVVCRLEEQMIGISVDEVHQLVNVTDDDLTERPKDYEKEHDLISDHVFKFEENLVQIIDEKVLGSYL